MKTTNNPSKKVVFAHSPDADDAFMYYGIAEGVVETGKYTISHELSDIQSLNQLAKESRYEVTAISAAHYPVVADKYRIMSCGASIGRRYGPIVVSKTDLSLAQLATKRIASPGPHTTSWLLYQLFAEYGEVVQMDFEKIMPAVLNREVDAGIVLHEGQLTYADFNLHKIADLGEIWFNETALPIPLGLDLVRRDLGAETTRDLTKILKRSILYARDNEDAALAYALKYGRGVSQSNARRFVRMYVSDDTVDMGSEGQRALATLYQRAVDFGALKKSPRLDILWV